MCLVDHGKAGEEGWELGSWQAIRELKSPSSPSNQLIIPHVFMNLIHGHTLVNI